MALPALYNWWRDPVFAYRTRKVTNEGVIIDKASCCTQFGDQVFLGRLFRKASCRFAQAGLSRQCYRPGFVCVSSVLHRIFSKLQSQLVQSFLSLVKLIFLECSCLLSTHYLTCLHFFSHLFVITILSKKGRHSPHNWIDEQSL